MMITFELSAGFPPKKEAWDEGNYKITARCLYGKTSAISCKVLLMKDKSYLCFHLLAQRLKFRTILRVMAFFCCLTVSSRVLEEE